MPAFLITGNPAAGKTSMAVELTRRGLTAIDTDELAGWETTTGVQVSQPEHASDEWLLSHRWVWSRARMEGMIRAHTSAGQHIFVCGIATNQREMLDLFEKVFLVSLDQETQLERLDKPSNAHRNAALRAQIVNGRPLFEQEMRSAGVVDLDARQPITILASSILEDIFREFANQQ